MQPKTKRIPWYLVLLIDLLLCGIGLCLFAYFHHIRILWNIGMPDEPEIVVPVPRPPSFPSDTDTDVFLSTDLTDDTDVTDTNVTDTDASDSVSQTDTVSTDTVTDTETISQTTTETEPPFVENLGQFGAKFPDRFAKTAAEVISTADRYVSRDLDITYTKLVYTGEKIPVNYHVLDIYVRNLENFFTVASLTSRRYFTDMVAATGCVIAISGDYCGNTNAAYEVLRNGTEMRSSNYIIHDLCVLGYDGKLSVFTEDNYDRNKVMALNPYQIWNFGPILVENGKNKTNFSKNRDIAGLNPRVAIGEIEPGHYIFIVVEGQYPKGIKLSALAKILKNMGCVTAYNLDGGASAHGYFNGTILRNGHPDDDTPRKLYDIVCIGEVAQ